MDKNCFKSSRKRYRTASADKSIKKPAIIEEIGDFNINNLGMSDIAPTEAIATAQQNMEEVSMENIVDSVKSLQSKFEDICGNQTILDDKVSGPDGVINVVGNIELELGETSGTVATLNVEKQDLQNEVAMLKSLVIKQSELINNLRKDVIDLKTRSMRNNVLVHNVPESQVPGPENCISIVKNILSKDLGYTEIPVIERAHRLGSALRSGLNKPRPIVVRFLAQNDADNIISDTKKINKGAPRDKANIKITSHFPSEVQEERRKMGLRIEQVQRASGDDKLKVKMTNSELYINGEKQRELLVPPTTREILNMSPHERSETIKNAPTLIQGDTLSEKGSHFTATVAEVKSIQDVRAAYCSLLCDPAKAGASHNIAVYRLSSPFNPGNVKSSFFSDGEHGAGAHVNYHLHRRNKSNIVVFITRTYGGVHVGTKRFELFEKALDSALSKLK